MRVTLAVHKRKMDSEIHAKDFMFKLYFTENSIG